MRKENCSGACEDCNNSKAESESEKAYNEGLKSLNSNKEVWSIFLSFLGLFSIIIILYILFTR
ncbi:MAG: hypothetical protein L3J07_00195 [Candidatus Magasanikbacteria bacterium]|nr:hypothetical protein [Candidatus Magasanikbacteria bacterium]